MITNVIESIGCKILSVDSFVDDYPKARKFYNDKCLEIFLFTPKENTNFVYQSGRKLTIINSNQ
jgi:hypothetical protein